MRWVRSVCLRPAAVPVSRRAWRRPSASLRRHRRSRQAPRRLLLHLQGRRRRLRRRTQTRGSQKRLLPRRTSTCHTHRRESPIPRSEFRRPCRPLHRPRSGRRSCKRSSRRRPSHPWAPVGCRSCRRRPPLRLPRLRSLLHLHRSSPKLRLWRRRADSLRPRRSIAERSGRSRLVREIAGSGPSSPGSPWWHRRRWSPRSCLGIDRPYRNRRWPRPLLHRRRVRRR